MTIRAILWQFTPGRAVANRTYASPTEEIGPIGYCLVDPLGFDKLNRRWSWSL